MAAFLAGQKSKVYPNAPAGLLFYGDAGVPKAFNNDKFRDFSPRLGLVLKPHGDGRDTIRIGGAMLFDSPEVYYSERLTTNAPYGNSIDLGSAAGPLSNPWLGYPGGNPFPGTYPPSPNVTFPTFAAYSTIPMNLHPTYMTQWNVSYHRQLRDNWLVSVSYLGNKTSHLWLSVDINHIGAPVAKMRAHHLESSRAKEKGKRVRDRQVPPVRQPDRGVHHGGFGDSDVEEALRESRLEHVAEVGIRNLRAQHDHIPAIAPYRNQGLAVRFPHADRFPELP